MFRIFQDCSGFQLTRNSHYWCLCQQLLKMSLQMFEPDKLSYHTSCTSIDSPTIYSRAQIKEYGHSTKAEGEG